MSVLLRHFKARYLKRKRTSFWFQSTFNNTSRPMFKGRPDNLQS